MNSGWTQTSLDAITTIGSGSAPRLVRDGIYRVMGANGPIGSSTGFNFFGGYLLGRVGAAGSVVRAREKCWASDNTLTVKPSLGLVDVDFLNWLLKGADIKRIATQTAQPLITQTQVGRLMVNIPPLSEQRRIAEILDTLDDQIRATEQIIAKLKLTKQGLVSDLFSGDWPIARIGESATLITSGSRGWARYYSDEGAKFIRIGNLTRTHINLRFDSLVHVRVPFDGEGSRTSLRRDDLLISITADLGIIGVVPSDLGEAYINQHIALVRFNEEEVNSRWIGHYLSSPLGRAQFSRLNDQGAKAGLNLPTISNLKFPAPSSAVQRKVVAVLDALDDRVTHGQLEVQKLQKQKQGLMSDLLTGRVRVPLETAL